MSIAIRTILLQFVNAMMPAYMLQICHGKVEFAALHVHVAIANCLRSCPPPSVDRREISIEGRKGSEDYLSREKSFVIFVSFCSSSSYRGELHEICPSRGRSGGVKAFFVERCKLRSKPSLAVAGGDELAGLGPKLISKF